MIDAPLLPAWITPAHFTVLRRLVETLDAWDLPHLASGGLAGNVHGSLWPLHDIDLDVPRSALEPLARAFSHEVSWGPARYADAEFELDLLRLTVDGIEVDLTAAESVVLCTPAGERVPWPTDFARAELHQLGPLALRVTPLADLVAYKRVIGRSADLRELTALAARR